MIRAVTLDAGGTLVEPWPSVGHVYAAEAERHGWPGLCPDELNRRFRRAWAGRGSDFNHTRAEWARLVDRTFGSLVAVPPSGSFFPQLFERFAQASAWRVFPEVDSVLTALSRKGVPVAVISNWDGRLVPLLERLDLARRFVTVVVSCEVGWNKPDRRIFLEAARRLGLEPAHILHVGDDAEQDTAGALGAGLQARTLVRQSGPPALGSSTMTSLQDTVVLAGEP